MKEELGWAFVDVEEVVFLHRIACELQEGISSHELRAGCIDGCIDGAITSALYAAGGDEPDLLLAAAYLLVYLAKNHCFTDGNKRAAWSAMVRALDVNGLRIAAEQEDAARLVNGVAANDLQVRDVLAWLAHPGRIVAAPEM